MDTLPLPPEPAPLPPAPVSAHRRVLAAYDRIAETGTADGWTVLRPSEDVLVDAKAVDDRVQTGECLPLAGTLVAVRDEVDVDGLAAGARSATALTRLTGAGAVVLGRTSHDPVALGAADAVVGASGSPAGVVALRPTAGLVPRTGMGSRGRVTVFARGVADGVRVLAAMTGPDELDPDSREWPDSVRLAAGERPRVAVPETALPALSRTVADLVASGVGVRTINGTGFGGFDALLLPDSVELDPRGLAAVTVPAGATGVTVLSRAFDDQVALDLAAFLHGEQLINPYPATGIDIVVFGGHLRGQPLNAALTTLGARFRGEVRTGGHYRMFALPGSSPEPGIVRSADGAAIAGERWTISPGELDRFAVSLPDALRLSQIELEGGGTAWGVVCAPEVVGASPDITAFGDWRAYLRYLTATRPMCA